MATSIGLTGRRRISVRGRVAVWSSDGVCALILQEPQSEDTSKRLSVLHRTIGTARSIICWRNGQQDNRIFQLTSEDSGHARKPTLRTKRFTIPDSHHFLIFQPAPGDARPIPDSLAFRIFERISTSSE